MVEIFRHGRSQPSVVEYLEERLAPIAREILTNRAEPNFHARLYRQTLGHARNYDMRAREGQKKGTPDRVS